MNASAMKWAQPCPSQQPIIAKPACQPIYSTMHGSYRCVDVAASVTGWLDWIGTFNRLLLSAGVNVALTGFYAYLIMSIGNTSKSADSLRAGL